MPTATLEDRIAAVEQDAKVLKARRRTADDTPLDAYGDPVRKGIPFVRRGADTLSSAPFSIAKLSQVTTGAAGMETVPTEIAESNRLRKAMVEFYGQGVGDYPIRSFLVPLAWECIPDQIARDSQFDGLKKSMDAGVGSIDPDYFDSRAAVQTYTKGERVVLKKTAMSWINQQTGGALVAPAAFGDLIPILRNKLVLQNIGATNVPLPTQGSYTFPRQTGVTTPQNLPENTAATESNPTYDDVTMTPKQFITLVRASNQLLTTAPALAEASIRNDLGEQIARKFDLDGLEGKGGPNRITGLINQPGISTVVAKTTGANGDTWKPVDVARIIRAAMAKNSDVKTWVMRPDMWLGITETRADAVTPGDAAGGYLWSLMRQFADDFGTTLRQRAVVTSNQVSGSRTKGSGTTLTYILGVDGQEVMVGMHGVLVIDANPWETTAYASNQTLMRAILFGDVAVRRPAGIAFMDSLIIPNLDS